VSKGKKFPKDVIDVWPEVFGEISLNVVPLGYLDTVTIKFKNNKIWEINLSKYQKQDDGTEFESSLKDVLTSYESEIDKVDFKLDTERIKKDVINHTTKFLKKRKLK
jgi:hypothetical protein